VLKGCIRSLSAGLEPQREDFMKTTFSFEFFPPKTDDGIAPLMNAARELAALNPGFMTMTYGAGGSGKTTTAELAVQIQKDTKVPTAAHLTFINQTRDELRDFTAALWKDGITRIVALRGDFPEAWQAPDYAQGAHYRYTDEFVRGIRAHHDFDISVGAYPEKHPDAPDMGSDIEALKKKCAAGAARAITQFFFDNATYYRFLDLAAKAGITTPIFPGLLPIQNFSRAQAFAKRCGAGMPSWLENRFANLSETDAHKAAADILATQVADLKRQGVPHFHFYTLNKAPLCMGVCFAAGLVE
jgi:methylenetetrahydrofolate reductase (NADPH)